MTTPHSFSPRAAAAAVLVILACFCFFAGDGLRAYFTGDDMMNIYKAWAMSPAQLVRDNVLFFTGPYRPLGLLFYRVWFALFQLNPVPYRVACLCLLLANLGLLYLFCVRLTGSRETGAIACLLAAYHARLADLYYSTGTIYDLLCYFFSFAALLYYTSIRERGLYPNWRQTAALLILFVCALDAKEMAAALPAIVLFYEVIYHSPRCILSRFPVISAAFTIAYVIGKMTVADRMINNPAYHLNISGRGLLFGCKHYLFDLFYGSIAFNDLKIILFLTSTLLIAALARDRHLLFAWLVLVFGTLPVIFIPPRGLYAIYPALPGAYLFAARCLLLLRGSLASVLDIQPAQLLLFTMVLVILIPLHRDQKPQANSWVAETPAQLRSLARQLTAHHTAMPRAGKVRFVSDPFPVDDWMLTFFFRLKYGDSEIDVDRSMTEPKSTYSHVFTFENGTLRELAR